MRVAKEGLNSANQSSRRSACYDILDYFVLYIQRKKWTEINHVIFAFNFVEMYYAHFPENVY